VLTIKGERFLKVQPENLGLFLVRMHIGCILIKREDRLATTDAAAVAEFQP
jgi:hypothetical protein